MSLKIDTKRLKVGMSNGEDVMPKSLSIASRGDGGCRKEPKDEE